MTRTGRFMNVFLGMLVMALLYKKKQERAGR